MESEKGPRIGKREAYNWVGRQATQLIACMDLVQLVGDDRLSEADEDVYDTAQRKLVAFLERKFGEIR